MRSGALTVCAQPSAALCPWRIIGAPGKVPPVMFQPSFEVMCASYQATGPSHGWWELMMSRVMPSVAREPATACAFEPAEGRRRVREHRRTELGGLLRADRLDHVVDVQHDGQLVGEGGGDVSAAPRQQPRVDVARVAVRPEVEPSRVRLEHRAHVGGQAVVGRVDLLPHAHQLGVVVVRDGELARA